jgi:AcrR family transcriptional regulator
MPRPGPPPRRTKGVLGGRSDEVVRAVLAAAIGELARSGYAGLRMDEVATRAGVNRTTLYRRWPSRVALVMAVVERLRTPLRDNPLPDTGALERDLVEAFTRRWNVGRDVEARAWARLQGERSNPEVEAIVGHAIDGRRAEWRTMITRAIERGEVPRGTDPQLVLDFVRAIVDLRGAERLDATWLAAAVRTVVAGARAGTLIRPRARPRGRTQGR